MSISLLTQLATVPFFKHHYFQIEKFVVSDIKTCDKKTTNNTFRKESPLKIGEFLIYLIGFTI